MGADAETRVYANRGKLMAGDVKEGGTAQAEKKKPYEQMQYPCQRVQIDVKVVPRRCIAGPQRKLYRYTAIDGYSRYRVPGAYEKQSAFFLRGLSKQGRQAVCPQRHCRRVYSDR